MSKAFKKIGQAVSKTFKKVTDTVKKVAKSKIGKVLIAAAAIYFTGGLAAGSFAPSAVGAQLTSWVSAGANAVGNFASSIFGGGAAGAAGTTGAAGAATGATTTSLATALGSSAPTMSTALGSAAGTSAATAASMAAPAAAAASPSIFSQAVTGFAKLPATTQLMLGNAAMQGFGAVAQQRQQQQLLDEQRRREEAAKGNFTPVKLEPFRPQSIYSRVG